MLGASGSACQVRKVWDLGHTTVVGRTSAEHMACPRNSSGNVRCGCKQGMRLSPMGRELEERLGFPDLVAAQMGRLR